MKLLHWENRYLEIPQRSSFLDYAELGLIGKEGNTTANKCVASRIVFVGKTTNGKKLLRQTAPMQEKMKLRI